MANHRAVGRAGESSVGQQQNVVSQVGAHDGAGDCQHLLHTGASSGAFVADYHNVAGIDLVARDRLETGAFSVIDLCRAFVCQVLGSGDLHHGSFRGQIASEDDETACGAARLGNRMHHRAVGPVIELSQIFADCLACDGHDILVEKALFLKLLHDHRNTPHLVHVRHYVATAGSQVRQVGSRAAETVEVVDL